MFNGRGCFGACLNDNFVYVLGGVNGRNFNHGQGQGKVSVNLDVNEDEQVTPEDGLMSACEKYDIQNDQWYQICNLPVAMRNSSACALSSDSVYLFGGKICSENSQLVLSDMILQYIVGSNVWLEMPIRLPEPMSLITPVKINSHQIALFGGLQYVVVPSETPTSSD